MVRPARQRQPDDRVLLSLDRRHDVAHHRTARRFQRGEQRLIGGGSGIGIDVQHIVNADISLPRFQYATPQQWAAFSSELLSHIQAEPGLQDSAIVVPRPSPGIVPLLKLI